MQVVQNGLILTLICTILLVGVVSSGCVHNRFEPTGWDGLTRSGDTLYISSDGKFLALSLEDRSIRDFTPRNEDSDSGSILGCAGSSAPALTSYSPPVVSGSLFYVGTYIGEIYALDAMTGAEKWEYDTEKQIVGAPVISGSTLVVAAGDKLFTFDAETGMQMWPEPFDTGGKIWSTPFIHDDAIYFGHLNHKVYAVDLETKKEKWERSFSGAFASTPLVVDDTLYIGSLDNKFYALDIDSGETVWEYQCDNWIWTRAVFNEGTIYFGSFGGSVYALDAETGQLKPGWRAPYRTGSGDRIHARPVIAGGVLVVGSQDDYLYGIQTDDGTQAWAPLHFEDDIMADLYLSGTTVFVLDKDDRVHAVNTERGNRLWSVSLDVE